MSRRGSRIYNVTAAATPLLPMSRAELTARGWDRCDVILVTGDAYVDHPSYGVALISRLLESKGWRVGIIAQPDWRSLDDFQQLGAPRLFFGVTGGNVDSHDREPQFGQAPSQDGRLRARRPGRPAARPRDHRLREPAARGVPGGADRPGRPRGQPAPPRPLRLLGRQGAPLGAARRPGRHPGLRHGRAPDHGDRAAVSTRGENLDGIRGTVVARARGRGAGRRGGAAVLRAGRRRQGGLRRGLPPELREHGSGRRAHAGAAARRPRR